MIPKSSLVSRVKCQAGSEQLGILWYIIIHNGNIEGECTHIIIEWTQMEGGEVTIVTSGYGWIACVCACRCTCMRVCTCVYSVVQAKY